MRIEDNKFSWVFKIDDTDFIIAARPSFAKNFLGRGIDVVFAGKQPIEIVFHKANYPTKEKIQEWFGANANYRAKIDERLSRMVPQKTRYFSF